MSLYKVLKRLKGLNFRLRNKYQVIDCGEKLFGCLCKHNSIDTLTLVFRYIVDSLRYMNEKWLKAIAQKLVGKKDCTMIIYVLP